MPPKDLVTDLLPPNALAVLVGPSKSGKSDLAAAIAVAVATGRPFAGYSVDAGPVLWLDYDSPRFPIKLPKTANLYIAHQLPPLDREETKQVLLDAVRKVKPKLVVIDSLQGAIQKRLDSRECVLFQLADLHALCNGTLMVLHQTTKQNHGVPQLKQMAKAAEVLIQIAGADPRSFNRNLIITPRNRSSHAVRLQTSGPGSYRQPGAPRSVAKNTVPDRILSLLAKQPLATNEITQCLQTNPGSTRNAISQLRREGRIHKTRAKKYALCGPFGNLNVTTTRAEVPS